MHLMHLIAIANRTCASAKPILSRDQVLGK
jgi:hypothetical protein